MFAGDHDIDRAVADLARLLPESLKPLARVAYDYRWSWSADGEALFKDIDAERWARCGHNPRRLLAEVHQPTLVNAGNDLEFVARVGRIAEELLQARARPSFTGFATPMRPVAFCCSEFGIHGSLPIYSGGLGVLAGDILKEAADLAHFGQVLDSCRLYGLVTGGPVFDAARCAELPRGRFKQYGEAHHQDRAGACGGDGMRRSAQEGRNRYGGA